MYFRMGEDGRRNKWTVKVKASRLVACCLERINYHTARIGFWDKERNSAEEKLRSGGIQLRHFDVSGGQRMEAQLDVGLAKRVSECESNLKSHQDSVHRFVAFKALVRLAGDNDMEMNADDVLYFNLEGADVGEAD